MGMPISRNAGMAVAVALAIAAIGAAITQQADRAGFVTAAKAETSHPFAPIAAVLRHPRCMNCHPRDDRPRQGDDRHVHQMNIVRGEDDMGFVNARCTACHRDENNKHSGVPGAPNWHLAPLSMGWNGLDDKALCETLLDTAKNGGRTLPQLVAHMTADQLVLWGWAPGGKREPVTTPHADFVSQLKAWEAAGAPCPQS